MTCDAFRAAHLAGVRDHATDAHLEGCRSCRSAVADLDEVSRRLADPAIWEEPGPTVLDRLLVTAEAEGRRAPSGRRTTSRHPARRMRPLAGAAAVVLLVVAAVAVRRGGGDAPDWRMALVPTAVAPGATATVEGWLEASGTRLELDVEGVPPSGPGARYALWLTAPDGRHVSAGTFTSAGTVRTWAGATRAEFPRLWVTLEPDDGDESLSGATVLDTPSP